MMTETKLCRLVREDGVFVGYAYDKDFPATESTLPRDARPVLGFKACWTQQLMRTVREGDPADDYTPLDEVRVHGKPIRCERVLQ